MQTKHKKASQLIETVEEKSRNGKYEAILRAAVRVFARSAYFNAKVSDVARTAAVAVGTVPAGRITRDTHVTNLAAAHSIPHAYAPTTHNLEPPTAQHDRHYSTTPGAFRCTAASRLQGGGPAGHRLI